MLDAGSAKHTDYDEHFKQNSHIESRIICRLINSPDYLGRTYSCVGRDPDKYIKNKQIYFLNRYTSPSEYIINGR